MPVKSRVVDRHLGVERTDPAFRGDDQRIDLAECRVGLLEAAVEGGHDPFDLLAFALVRDTGEQLARVVRLEALERIDMDAHQRIGALGGDLLDLDPALRGEHEQRLAGATVERDREVVLAGDVRGGLDPEAAHDMPPDIEPQDLRRPGLRLVRPVGELHPAGLPAATGQNLRLHHDRPAELLGRGARLRRCRRHPPRRDRDPEASQELFPRCSYRSTAGKSRCSPRQAYSAPGMPFADQLTLARIACAPLVVILFTVDFQRHDYWGTAVFCVAMSTDWFDGRIARRSGRTTSFGSLLDPVADKVLVLATLIVLLDQGVFPAWMVAAIVARELLVSGLRLAAIERGVVIAARDLGKLKTWSQALAAAAGGLAAAGLWSDSVSWWLLLIAVVLTWVSGLDYARSAPSVLRGRAVAPL